MTLFDAPPPRAPLVRRSVMLLVVVSMWAGPVACLWMNESALVFQAHRSRVPRLVPGSGLLELRTSGGFRLDALLFPSGEAEYWILFCPPSGRTIHGYVLRRHLESLRAAGFNVFAFDYRGFGRNSGIPSEAGLYEDALTAYRHLTELGVAPSRIILAGRSLGSAVAIDLATRVPSGGMLLLSAIDSVPATAARLYPWAPVTWLASLEFDSLAKAPRIQSPVLQVHASEDWLVPVETARGLFARFPGRKVMLELPGGHNDVGFRDESLIRTLAQFWSNPR